MVYLMKNQFEYINQVFSLQQLHNQNINNFADKSELVGSAVGYAAMSRKQNIFNGFLSPINLPDLDFRTPSGDS